MTGGRKASLGPALSRKTVLGEGTVLGNVGGTPRSHCSTVAPRAGDRGAVFGLPWWPLNPHSFSVLPFLGPDDKSQQHREISVTLDIFWINSTGLFGGPEDGRIQTRTGETNALVKAGPSGREPG